MDEKVYGWWLPPDISVHGAKIDQLMSTVHWFMLLLFVGWGAFFVYCLIKYRARDGHTAVYAPVHAVFTKYVEAAVVVVEVFLLFALSTPVWLAYKNSPPSEKEAVHVRIVAEQFAWNFQYPGKDGKFGRTNESLIGGDNPVGLDPEDKDGKDDIVTVNQLHIPVHKPVIVEVSSKDVIHSFNIPVLRVKQDTIPGQRTRSGLKPPRPGTSSWAARSSAGWVTTACAPTCWSTRPRIMRNGRRRTRRRRKRRPPPPRPTPPSSPPPRPLRRRSK
jgi:cytochrome c oxidase subunit 2